MRFINQADQRTSNGQIVEVNVDGSWGGLCDDTFTMAEANLVCKQMGHPGAKEVNVDMICLRGMTFQLFKLDMFVLPVVKVVKGAGRETTIPIASLKCAGDETCLGKCLLDHKTRCRPDRAVAVVCRWVTHPYCGMRMNRTDLSGA